MTYNDNCLKEEHDWEWEDWSSSIYLGGYWVCRNCGEIKYSWQKIDSGSSSKVVNKVIK